MGFNDTRNVMDLEWLESRGTPGEATTEQPLLPWAVYQVF